MKLGTKIIGVYGARHPIMEGKVIKIRKCCWTKSNKNDLVEVVWDNDDECRGKHRRRETIKMTKIDSAPNANGSPIGFYTEEGYYG